MKRQAIRSILFLGLALTTTGSADDKKSDVKPSKEEQGVLDLTNAARKKALLPALQFNSKLMDLARAHAMNMAKQEKFEHDLDGKSMADRLKEAEYGFTHAGENIAWKQKTPREAMKTWMESEEHQENILSKEFVEIGVGMAKSAKGDYYWVQLFGCPLVR